MQYLYVQVWAVPFKAFNLPIPECIISTMTANEVKRETLVALLNRSFFIITKFFCMFMLLLNCQYSKLCSLGSLVLVAINVLFLWEVRSVSIIPTINSQVYLPIYDYVRALYWVLILLLRAFQRQVEASRNCSQVDEVEV